MYKEDDYLMLSGIQHFAFCRRQWALIHIEQQWEENYKTTSGELMHKKAHDENAIEKRGKNLIVRGLRIASQGLGLSAQCDVVEFHQKTEGIHLYGYDGYWEVVPIEYKHGIPKENNADELQLCAQAICLEEMFQTKINEGFLFYGEERRRTKIDFTENLREQVSKISMEMHDLFQKGYTPKAKYAKHCNACSLKNLCVPKLQKAQDVKSYIDTYINLKE